MGRLHTPGAPRTSGGHGDTRSCVMGHVSYVSWVDSGLCLQGLQQSVCFLGKQRKSCLIWVACTAPPCRPLGIGDSNIFDNPFLSLILNIDFSELALFFAFFFKFLNFFNLQNSDFQFHSSLAVV